MNDEDDKLGSGVKHALETETGQLTLAPHIRRTVIAAAERGNDGGWAWLTDHKLALTGAACVLIVLGVILHANRKQPPHRPEPYMQMSAEVRGGRGDSYWKKKCVEIRTRNGQEGYIRVEAKWPKRTSVITLNTRRKR
jgi:hypothetical protein